MEGHPPPELERMELMDTVEVPIVISVAENPERSPVTPVTPAEMSVGVHRTRPERALGHMTNYQ